MKHFKFQTFYLFEKEIKKFLETKLFQDEVPYVFKLARKSCKLVEDSLGSYFAL